MFKIIDFRTVAGKVVFTIETDDFTSSLLLRFLGEADKFAEGFFYRLKTESKVAAYQKTKPVKMAQARRSRAQILKKFREIPGSSVQRARILKEICVSEGMDITLDRLMAELRVARKEERLRNNVDVKQLIGKGKSFEEISSILSISKSTVARLAKEMREKGQSHPGAKKPLLSAVGRGAESEKGGSRGGNMESRREAYPSPSLESPRARLRFAWTMFLSEIDEIVAYEWFGHLTHADATHPEQSNRQFLRWLREINIDLFGHRYRTRGEGVLVIRASEWQRRGVLHYHFLAGGGVARLRRLSYMDLWASSRCGMGWARIYPYDRFRGAVRYTTKYAVKGGEIDIFASPDITRRLRDRSVSQELPFRLHS